MKTKNIVKALEKQGYLVESFDKDINDVWQRVLYKCKTSTFICTWFHCKYSGRAQCLHAGWLRSMDDARNDYAPGVWPDTIKELLHYMRY